MLVAGLPSSVPPPATVRMDCPATDTGRKMRSTPRAFGNMVMACATPEMHRSHLPRICLALYGCFVAVNVPDERIVPAVPIETVDPQTIKKLSENGSHLPFTAVDEVKVPRTVVKTFETSGYVVKIPLKVFPVSRSSCCRMRGVVHENVGNSSRTEIVTF